ncbi:KdsC family phosphatase [Polynucleobacter kasalickyi]|uniref:3-deoxy-D-manno-octulosonate 8-phosphate phosphatase KdsC n=1 Tax=Polynucleobacter kasalickyi TaxID=1938817 RepID=A0A1W2ARF9_9BURK|nr:HAD family hydrolase [Polynucleobacter kasalickyi]SMC62798.1 3-deoxy-D-manno-octulosonate 8-phosphate phosphatase (KDO 8-P phosphatase) [Polynucleobacter kasalickyi]
MSDIYLTNQIANFPQALERAQHIQLLILDVDGVLTDGSLFISPDGLEHIKVFNSLDGHGIKLLVENGIQCAIISGRNSEMVTLRAKALGIEHVFLGVHDKLVVFESLREKLGLPYQACAAMGDDWPDLSVLARVGLPVAPAQAHVEVLNIARFITRLPGGNGAVREVCDLILKAQDKYAPLLRQAL